MEGGTGLEALWKLGGDVAGHDVVALPAVRLPADARLADLFAAVAERRVLRFSYQGSSRQVEPHRLDFRRGRWYITAFDRDRQAERNFRLDRIEGALEVGPAGAFEARDLGSGAGAAWELGDEAEVNARLLVDADHAPWASHHLGDAADVEEQSDGSVVFSLRVTNRAAFRSFVLGFLEHAEVLEPPELRADMVEWVRRQVEEPA
jgi:proteasome accessory factor B